MPATQLDLVSKYIGAGEDTPVRLNKLGGDQWQKTKAKAKAAAWGSGCGPHQALCRAQAPAGLRLRGGFAVAAGV